jgi:uncharacterized protein with GYD domain
MAHYIYLGNLTQQGMTNISGVHERWDSFVKLLESKGGKLVAFYTIFGPYDYVVIVDLPSDLAALEVAVVVGNKGNVKIETCRAFDYAEYAKAVEAIKLP